MRKPRILIILAFAADSTRSDHHWQVDDRCTRRRAAALQGVPSNPAEDDHRRASHDADSELSKATLNHKSLRGHDDNVRRLDSLEFMLKLHWEVGYCWQEEWNERRWCLACEGSNCGVDDQLILRECDTDDDRQWFVYESVDAGIKLKPYTNLDVCWTLTGFFYTLTLQECGSDFLDASGNDKQVILGFESSGSTFELSPNGREEEGDCYECPQCISNTHHPKNLEIVRAHDCDDSRNDKTSLWEVIHPTTRAERTKDLTVVESTTSNGPTTKPTPSPTDESTTTQTSFQLATPTRSPTESCELDVSNFTRSHSMLIATLAFSRAMYRYLHPPLRSPCHAR